MTCRVTDIRNKEVINIKDGSRIGFVCDVEINTVNAQVVAIIVFGRPRCFGLFGREEDIVIRWSDIQVIGEDTILVSFDCRPDCKRRKGGVFSSLFGSK